MRFKTTWTKIALICLGLVAGLSGFGQEYGYLGYRWYAGIQPLDLIGKDIHVQTGYVLNDDYIAQLSLGRINNDNEFRGLKFPSKDGQYKAFTMDIGFRFHNYYYGGMEAPVGNYWYLGYRYQSGKLLQEELVLDNYFDAYDTQQIEYQTKLHIPNVKLGKAWAIHDQLILDLALEVGFSFGNMIDQGADSTATNIDYDPKIPMQFNFDAQPGDAENYVKYRGLLVAIRINLFYLIL